MRRVIPSFDFSKQLTNNSWMTRFTPSQILIAASLFFGFLFRIRLLSMNNSYWYDEAYLLLNIYSRSFQNLLGATDYLQVAPPAYLWCEKAVSLLFGQAEWSMRLPAFIAGILALLLLIPLANASLLGRLNWLPVALLALSRHAIERSCEVKPYSSDLMMTVAILLATVGVLGHANRPRRQWAMGALLSLALFGPWISFPSVYFLGGAVAALLLKSVLDRSRREAAWAFLTGGILLSSIGLLWYCHARHLYQDGLNQHFQLIGGFPDWTSRHGPFVWPITCFIDLGNYGTRNMGILLLIFACVGCRRFIRLNPSMAVVLCLPLLVAIAGTYFNKYPLSGRTTLFILPALWILATAGLTEISERFSTWRWVTLLPWILLASDVLGYASSMLKMPRTPAVREAIEYIHAHRQADDVIWGSHIEVYYVYSGQGDRVFGYLSHPQDVLRTANGGPIWLMEQPLNTVSYRGELIQLLNANGYRETLHHELKGVIVSCMKKPTLPE